MTGCPEHTCMALDKLAIFGYMKVWTASLETPYRGKDDAEAYCGPSSQALQDAC